MRYTDGKSVRGARGLGFAGRCGVSAHHFTELDAWRLCEELQAQVIALTARPVVARDFKYCTQILDASRSSTSNIAEGFRRYSHGELGQFLDISLASLAEVQSLLREALLRQFVTTADFERLWQLSKRADKVTSALRRSLRRREAPTPRPFEPRRQRRKPPS